ncbi:hypothetical protein C8F04DRAFT_1185544 [Mycena alexandri]|uniref:Uncharacterized protein n=1 Tax=Mycena alexandri TaxID=1745969 RepID=A0AAD6SSP4_9AGAR|nr:hypothetical protein C8F04DRAFT_1185544 [Mycena alexandri]
MLFLVVFILLLAKHLGLTQGHSELISRMPMADSCDDINSCRTLSDIVWGCLATIFACTWVALHHNVPDPKLGWFSRLRRKLRMMLVTMIAPELIVSFAARQFVSALWISKNPRVFCTMGGFVSQEGHPIATMRQLPAYIAAIQDVEEEDIADRSKGDCLARVSQGLPITELEVATLAFAVVSIFIRLLWWWKPLDVQRPIVVVRSDEFDPLQEGNAIYAPDLVDQVANGIFVSGIFPNLIYFSSVLLLDSDGLPNLAGLLGAGIVFGSIHCAAWNALFPSTAEMWMWRIGSLFIVAYPVLTVLLGSCADGLGDVVTGAFFGICFVYPSADLLL